MGIRTSRRQSVEDLLVRELTRGGGWMDRSTFYAMTRDYDENRMRRLQEAVGRRVGEFFDSLGEVGVFPGRRMVAGELGKSWFSPQARVYGKLDYDLESHLGEVFRGEGDSLVQKVRFSDLTGICDANAQSVDAECLRNWLYDQAALCGLDYTAFPPAYVTDDRRAAFAVNYPWLVESKRDSIRERFFAGRGNIPSGSVKMKVRPLDEPLVLVTGQRVNAVRLETVASPVSSRVGQVLSVGFDVGGSLPARDLWWSDLNDLYRVMHRAVLKERKALDNVGKKF